MDIESRDAVAPIICDKNMGCNNSRKFVRIPLYLQYLKSRARVHASESHETYFSMKEDSVEGKLVVEKST